MTLGRTRAVALVGMTGSVIDIEADLSRQLPGFVLIGLPDTALSEASHRVLAAASNAGCALPHKKITVNLSPAALPKHGSAFDLGIAMAVLAADAQVEGASVERVVHIGELALDGRVRPTVGVLPSVVGALRSGFTRVMVPAANAAEASLVDGVTVIGVASLRDAAIWHGGDFDPVPVDALGIPETSHDHEATPELAEVVGNDEAVDALMIAAAGGHHMFLLGPPGSGKTMLASRLPGILPDLDPAAALEVSCLRSITGAAVGETLVSRPPWEAPHHTATAVAIVGGGSGKIRPGAASRSSHGVLFLDEAPEFSPSVLDSLRQPLESGVITIHRSAMVARFPSAFQLVLAANPCPCGNYGNKNADCSCPPYNRKRYLARISGPLMDRIDIRLRVPRITAAQFRSARPAPRFTTESARVRVSEARAAACQRLSTTPWRRNNDVQGPWLREGPCKLSPRETVALDRALERGAITMRGYDRVLRVAWSIADLAGANHPTADHIGRALFFRKGIT